MDDIDARLIHALQANGRMPAVELAKVAGVSRAAASQRLERLLLEGSLQIAVLPNRQVDGRQWAAHVLARPSAGAANPVQHLAAHPAVGFLSVASGDFGLVAEIRASDFTTLAAEISAVRENPAIERISASIYFEVRLDRLALNDEMAFVPDQIDRELIALLMHDGRRNYSSLAKALGMSTNAVRNRTLRLIDGKVIHIGALARRRANDHELSLGVGISASGESAPLVTAIESVPQVEFLALSVGTFDIVATVRAASRTEATEAIDAIRSLDSVGSITTWIHLDVVKDLYGPTDSCFS
ncbi:Lrp/AsnC family transcriptional regulator [Streptomyces yanii]|uniref:Lrp/AsnC family transcriptional regulator n=1 Tax=Streptomyces yanii TaxID=78510 RepID=UPI0031EA1F96